MESRAVISIWRNIADYSDNVQKSSVICGVGSSSFKALRVTAGREVHRDSRAKVEIEKL
jgi:hypothetical protein